MSANEEVKEQVRKDWTGNAKPWKAWREKFAIHTAKATELIVEASALSVGMSVLDLASGTGEPALSLARSVGPSGRVTATDLVPEMLTAISEAIALEGVSNVTVEVADMEALQYRDASFDRVTSRFGIMFA